MSIWKKPKTTSDLNELIASSMAGNLGIKIIEIGDDYLKSTMPLHDRTQQHMGFMHGGANVVLAETTANLASIMCCEDAQTVVGLEINANHIRAGRSMVTAIAQALHIGRKTMVWEIKIYDNNDKLTCASRFTGAVVPKSD